MSTAIKTTPQAVEAPKLRVVPTNIVDRFKAQAENIVSLEADLIAGLPDMEEDAIINLRRDAERLAGFSWVLVAACDAAIWNRNAFKSAPGRSDTEGVGIMAAVAKRAKEINSTYKTMRLNARIYNTFGERLNADVQTLPDKEFYLKALKSDDPHGALNQFIEHKKQNAKFSPALAEKLITDARKDAVQEKASIVEEFSQASEKSLLEHTQEFVALARQYRASCPDKDFARRMYDPIIEDFEDHIYGVMADGAMCKAVIAAWTIHCVTTEQIVIKTKLSRKDVEHILQCLVRDGEFQKVDRNGETIWWKSDVPLIRTGALRASL